MLLSGCGFCGDEMGWFDFFDWLRRKIWLRVFLSRVVTTVLRFLLMLLFLRKEMGTIKYLEDELFERVT